MELSLTQVGKYAVIHTLHRSRPWAVIDQANLSKVVARSNILLLARLPHVVIDGDLAFTTSYETQELFIVFVLLENYILWQEKLWLDLIDEELHYIFLFFFEKRV